MCLKQRHVARRQQHQRSTLPVDIVFNGHTTGATPTLVTTKYLPVATSS